MSHADDAHGLRVQLATALKERDEARHGLNEWCKAAMQERARVTAAESERDALRAALENLSAILDFSEPLEAGDLGIADPSGINAAFAQARAALAGGGDRGKICDVCQRPKWDGGHALNERECSQSRGEVCRLHAALAAANARADGFKSALELASKAGEQTQREIEEALAAARRECEGLRRLLWLHHGCSPAFLYGDDGEMQCGDAGCLLDFKRQSAEEIEARWIAANHAALAAPAAGEEGT